MQVYSSNKYRFMRPGAKLFEKSGTDVAAAMTKQLDFKDAFFELEPDAFMEAPDWIQEDTMFKWALKDGDIKIVQGGAEPKETPKKLEPKTDMTSTSEHEPKKEPEPKTDTTSTSEHEHGGRRRA